MSGYLSGIHELREQTSIYECIQFFHYLYIYCFGSTIYQFLYYGCLVLVHVDEIFISFILCFCRTSGLQHMTAELFFCLFKVYWKVCSSFILPLPQSPFCACLINYFLTTEPNLESPLNSYAAELWNDKEGKKYFSTVQHICFLI
jgi:hypothetical protein